MNTTTMNVPSARAQIWSAAGSMTLCVTLGLVTLALMGAGRELWVVTAVMIAWGALNSAIPVACSLADKGGRR